MLLDSKLVICDADAVFSDGTVVLSNNVLDLGKTTPVDIGRGHPIYLVIQVTIAFAGGTSANFQLVSDAAAAIATNGAASEHLATGAIPIASLTAGATFSFALPHQTPQAYERYLGLLVTCVGTMTAGSIDAFLTLTPQAWTPYPDASN